MSRGCAVLSLCLLKVFLSDPARGQETLTGCQESFEAAGAEWKSSCFSRAVRAFGRRQEAERQLRRNMERQPHNLWLPFNLAQIELDRGSYPQAEARFRRLAADFARRGEWDGEYYSRINLYKTLSWSGRQRLEEASTELAAAAQSAERMGDPSLVAEVRVQQARLLERRGKSLGRAYRLLRQVEAQVRPRGPYQIQVDCLLGLGDVAFTLGRYAAARGHYQELADLTRRNADRAIEATARFNVFASYVKENPRQEARPQAVRLARRALAVAREADVAAARVEANRVLGKLLGGAEGRTHLERCATVARTTQDPLLLSRCLRSLATHVVEESPDEARRLVAESDRLAFQSEDASFVTRDWFDRLHVRWHTLPRQEAVADSLAVLDYIETLRDLQDTGTVAAERFGASTDVFYWLSGRLLDGAGSSRREDLERAFAVAEGMRARLLLEALAATGETGLPADDSLALELGALLAEMARIQRRLFDPELKPEARRLAVAEVEQRKTEAAELRHRIAQGATAGPRSAIATLAEIEAELAPDEALLSFQIAPWQNLYGEFLGGSWLVVSTRLGSRAYRLSDRHTLEIKVMGFRDLVARRDGSETSVAQGLYRELLARALGDLPDVERLIVVPDGVLHLLPFGTLRPAPGDVPLALRYQVSIVPSATLWRFWRTRESEPAAEPALALADPAFLRADPGGGEPDPEGGGVGERGWALATGAQLGRLPYARREGRAVLEQLGGEAKWLRVGGEASERFLKSTQLGRFAALHFATHALLNDADPELSGVLLAPGGDDEDGLLQPWEIVELQDLEGRLVVLSTCDSAAGKLFLGEGAMSLARAFFEAGAHAVVASLWRLRDDDAAELVEGFYRHLGEGKSVAAALAGAQEERVRAGAPAAAWAGLVVLGDGGLVPVPGGRRPSLRGFGYLGLAVALVLLAGVLGGMAAWRRRRVNVGL